MLSCIQKVVRRHKVSLFHELVTGSIAFRKLQHSEHLLKILLGFSPLFVQVLSHCFVVYLQIRLVVLGLDRVVDS